MKALKPSHREKKRYLLIKGKAVDLNSKIIEKEILRFIGILGYSKASPMFIKTTKTSIIMSINRQALVEVRAAFAASSSSLRIEKVSGVVGKVK
jgi:RNase P/RNase MRP subunit POP5